MSMNNLLKKLLLVVNALLVCVSISIFANANEDEINIVGKNEEKAVISIINFGRSNPFEPYKEVKKIKKEEEKEADLEEIPYPPAFGEEDTEEYGVLMGSTVNGILYDPFSKSVAIVNISGTDYMLREGDMVQGVVLDKITENKVTLRYGANTYTVGVGEIVEGEVQFDPVERHDKFFAETGYKLPDLDVEELSKNE